MPAPQPAQTRSSGRAALPWFVASGVLVVLAVLLLVAGLFVASLGLVYASIAASILWLPLGIVGIVVMVRRS